MEVDNANIVDFDRNELDKLTENVEKLIRSRADFFEGPFPVLEAMFARDGKLQLKAEEYFPVPGMYGGFNLVLMKKEEVLHSYAAALNNAPHAHPLEGDIVVVSSSWCRVAGGSGQEHVVAVNDTVLVDEGFV